VKLGARLLVVDDVPENVKLLDAILSPRGYTLLPAASGAEALRKAADESPDLVLLDVVMPELDGYEVCRRIREDPATRLLPVIMITASGGHEKVRAIEAGADDFIQKPFDQAELLARVKSLLRIKQFQDELAELNRTLEARVAQQVFDLERVSRLRRFLSPQVAELVVSEGEAALLQTHRSEITAVFCDLRGFTAFAESVEPEEVIDVLREYHGVVARLVLQFEATLDHIAGDGILAYFNDPVPCVDAPLQAVRMAVAMRDEIGVIAESWRRRGHELDVGIGVSHGHATLGTIGSNELFHYASVGSVTNLAARLSDEARGGQVLISARVYAAVERAIDCESVGPLTLKGFARPVPAYDVATLRPS
jgi:class 3 adenylate cyclase/CheY-like chemotaxis protein